MVVMVDVMVELQRRRTASRIFQGKHGFITPRDLFRWADRRPGTYQVHQVRGQSVACVQVVLLQ